MRVLVRSVGGGFVYSDCHFGGARWVRRGVVTVVGIANVGAAPFSLYLLLGWSTCARSVVPSSIASTYLSVVLCAASSLLVPLETAAESGAVDPSAGCSEVGEFPLESVGAFLAGCHG